MLELELWRGVVKVVGGCVRERAGNMHIIVGGARVNRMGNNCAVGVRACSKHVGSAARRSATRIRTWRRMIRT